MTQVSEYIIPIGGLPLGFHEFKYSIDKSFFKDMTHSEVENCQVEIKVRAEKQSAMMVIEFEQRGSVQLNCDRCGDPYDHSIDAANQLIIKFKDTNINDTDDVVIMDEMDKRFDLTHYLYEYIHLQIPLKRVHKEAGCNPEALRKLETLQGINNDPAYVDPRWEGLKNYN